MIKKNQIFLVTKGSYSDYRVVALMRAKCDFNIDDYQPQTEYWSIDVDKAVTDMMRDGVAKPLTFKEFNGDGRTWDVTDYPEK